MVSNHCRFSYGGTGAAAQVAIPKSCGYGQIIDKQMRALVATIIILGRGSQGQGFGRGPHRRGVVVCTFQFLIFCVASGVVDSLMGVVMVFGLSCVCLFCCDNKGGRI